MQREARRGETKKKERQEIGRREQRLVLPRHLLLVALGRAGHVPTSQSCSGAGTEEPCSSCLTG